MWVFFCSLPTSSVGKGLIAACQSCCVPVVIASWVRNHYFPQLKGLELNSLGGFFKPNHFLWFQFFEFWHLSVCQRNCISSSNNTLVSWNEEELLCPQIKLIHCSGQSELEQSVIAAIQGRIRNTFAQRMPNWKSLSLQRLCRRCFSNSRYLQSFCFHVVLVFVPYNSPTSSPKNITWELKGKKTCCVSTWTLLLGGNEGL